jgi:hypothetical protein
MLHVQLTYVVQLTAVANAQLLCLLLMLLLLVLPLLLPLRLALALHVLLHLLQYAPADAAAADGGCVVPQIGTS